MANWPYNTDTWRKLRVAKLQAEPACEDCARNGRHKLANVVDHRHAISQGGDPFPALPDLASLCFPCHSRKTARGPEAGAVRTTKQRKGCLPDGTPLDASHPWNGGNGRITRAAMERRMPTDLKRSIIPLTIVCGAPGSGKSTYVAAQAAETDLVICLDTIMEELAGATAHQAPVALLRKGMEVRNRMLHSLAKPSGHTAAFFIVSAPLPRDRELWASRLGGRVVVMDTPSFECVRRIRADPSRDGRREDMIEAALGWWRANPHLVRKSLRPSRPGPVTDGPDYSGGKIAQG